MADTFQDEVSSFYRQLDQTKDVVLNRFQTSPLTRQLAESLVQRAKDIIPLALKQQFSMDQEFSKAEACISIAQNIIRLEKKMIQMDEDTNDGCGHVLLEVLKEWHVSKDTMGEPYVHSIERIIQRTDTCFKYLTSTENFLEDAGGVDSQFWDTARHLVQLARRKVSECATAIHGFQIAICEACLIVANAMILSEPEIALFDGTEEDGQGLCEEIVRTLGELIESLQLQTLRKRRNHGPSVEILPETPVFATERFPTSVNAVVQAESFTFDPEPTRRKSKYLPNPLVEPKLVSEVVESQTHETKADSEDIAQEPLFPCADSSLGSKDTSEPLQFEAIPSEPLQSDSPRYSLKNDLKTKVAPSRHTEAAPVSPYTKLEQMQKFGNLFDYFDKDTTFDSESESGICLDNLSIPSYPDLDDISDTSSTLDAFFTQSYMKDQVSPSPSTKSKKSIKAKIMGLLKKTKSFKNSSCSLDRSEPGSELLKLEVDQLSLCESTTSREMMTPYSEGSMFSMSNSTHSPQINGDFNQSVMEDKETIKSVFTLVKYGSVASGRKQKSNRKNVWRKIKSKIPQLQNRR